MVFVMMQKLFLRVFCNIWKVYEECDENCLTCYGPDSNECLSCDSSKNLVLYSNNCIEKTSIINGYYYDSSKNSFLHCQSPCETCSESKTNCSTYIENYCLYSNECLTETTVIPYYYCNSDNIYEKCSDNCFSCDSSACLVCLTDYELYNGQCYHKNTTIEGYFFNHDDNIYKMFCFMKNLLWSFE